jgi:hypothetical protein
MLKIPYSNIVDINKTSKLIDLAPFLQKALELEHSTIPPYLTAMYSIKRGRNRDIYRTLYSIALEEMLHFSIVCNLINAIGGNPIIYDSRFVPSYPCTLPLNINNSFIVSLERFSMKQLVDVFMEIEEPEKPLIFPELFSFKHFNENPTYGTIGLFYSAIKEKINAIDFEYFPGNPHLQVVSNRYSESELFPILKKEDAIRAIDIIVEQGEGTTKSPVDQFNHLAHYYRFKEISIGRKLIADSSVDEGYSYSGDDVEFEEAGIYPFSSNTKVSDLPIGTIEHEKAELFAKTYTQLLKGLHTTFNGQPENLSSTFQTMRDLTNISEALAQMQFPNNSSLVVGPPFEFIE